MTRPINVERANQERRIQDALEGVKSGQFKSYAEAARVLHIPKSTLCHRAKGRQTRIESHEDLQLLSNEEEIELTRWIGQLTVCGYPPKPYAVREMAEAIRTRRVIGVNDPSITHVSFDTIGEQWVSRFMARHPKLESTIAEQIDCARVKESTYPILEKWFQDVKSLIDDYDIQLKDIYNMDETGCSIGSIKATRVIIDQTKNQRYSAHPGRQEWVSVIECICMDGTALLPMIIFKGKSLSKQWLPENTPKDWFFSVNTEGWTSNEHAKKWLHEDFEPITREKADGRTRLFIFDGHGSHTTADVVRHCILNHIQLALLPRHSSHLTQPLDIGVFSSLKAHMAQQMDRYIRTGISRIQKAEWLDAFISARALAFTRRNILSGWSGTGLYPFNPQKVLTRVPFPPEVETPPRHSTPDFTTPFDNPQLTSSPIDTPALAMANTHIQQRADNPEQPFDTPARAHVTRIVRTLNRSLALNRIQAKQLSELQQIMTTRKQRQSGKNTILRGETIIATPVMLEQLEKAEAATKSRKSKRRKLTHPSTPPPLFIEKSLDPPSSGSEDGEDMQDCIVVAFS